MDSPVNTCPACGATASGRFCSECGASLSARACTACEAPLSPSAAFCHRCGAAAPGGVARVMLPAPASDRGAWLFAGAACIVLVLAMIFFLTRQRAERDRPDMANVGSAPGAVTGPAPDISQMTPVEQFNALFDRVTRAAQEGDSAEVVSFMPMALGAYARVPDPDLDVRFHSALLHLDMGDWPGALALADTMQTEYPGNLYTYIVRGTAARYQQDEERLQEAERTFLERYDEEMEARGLEYAEHSTLVNDFREEAQVP
ncbi:MAG: zinc ribbon domain-containing protein [Gemmatimonadales bacterium]